MIDFSEIQEIEIGDIHSWPIWFRWCAIVVGAIVLLFVGYKYVINPEQKILVTLEKQERELRDAFLKKKELALDLPAYEAQIIEIRDRFGVVLEQLPKQTEVPALLIDVSQAGLSRGLKFDQFRPDEEQYHDFYKTLPISITVTGKFHQLAEFISDLGSLPRIVTVENMNISRKAEQELVMKAELNTYQYLDDAEQKVGVDG